MNDNMPVVLINDDDGDKNCDVPEMLAEYKDYCAILKKDSADGFFANGFLNILREDDYQYMFLAGCMSDSDILCTAESFLEYKNDVTLRRLKRLRFPA